MYMSRYESLSIASVVFLSTNCDGYMFGISCSKCGLFSVSKSSIYLSMFKFYCYFLAKFKLILNIFVLIEK